MKFKNKIALIFGVTGQDGSYLSRLLLSKGYKVHGIKRRSSSLNTQRIDDIYEDFHDAKNFFLHYGDLNDGQSIAKLIKKIKPHEIYNLAAQSHVAVSFEIPEYTFDTNTMGVLKVLDAIKNINPKIKYYQAGTLRCLACHRLLKMKKLHFIQEVLMPYLNLQVIGSP